MGNGNKGRIESYECIRVPDVTHYSNEHDHENGVQKVSMKRKRLGGLTHHRQYTRRMRDENQNKESIRRRDKNVTFTNAGDTI